MWTNDEMQEKMGQIHNQDCLEFMKQVPDKYFDLVLADPPYNIGIDGGKGWDTIRNYENFIEDIFAQAKRISQRQVFFFDYSYTKLFENLAEPSERFIWHREGGFSGEWIKKAYEPFYVYGDIVNILKIPNQYAQTDRRLKAEKSISNVWSIPNLVGRKNERVNHPTQKPLMLIGNILRMMTNKDSKVFDPVMGSGTTAVACQSLGLQWCGCELEPDYVAIANKRLEKVQGSLF